MTSGVYSRPSIEQRFWSKVEKTDYCWNWTGNLGKGGYGRISTCGKYIQTHRFSYELLKGKIPQDLQLDHLCRNRMCCNPDHLEAVTQRENILRGDGFASKQAKQTHCIHGHPLSIENIYLFKNQRICKTCRKLRKK